jgi:ApaG protein
MNAYEATTHGIRVSVVPEFLADRSEPDDNYFVWAYTIIIENTSERTVTLRTRHWEIIDANGQRQHVDGEGVVGKQPTLGPGERFEYTSGCPLGTSSGFMTGFYTMESREGELINVEVPAFSLDSPQAGLTIN